MKVFIIAGEASGDKLGAALMEGLNSQTTANYTGIGGPLMQAQGLRSIFPMTDLSVMGLAEILPRYPHLKRRLRQTIEAVIAANPDVLITIDSPEFSHRVAKAVKARSQIKTVHYVAPSVWAWRPGRAEKMANFVDHMMALLPFEPPYMHKAGMSCDFVGHPIVQEPVPTITQIKEVKAKYKMGSKTLLILPGSRMSEVKRLLPVFQQTLEMFQKDCPEMSWILPVTGNVAEFITNETKTWSKQPVIMDPRSKDAEQFHAQKRAVFAAADLALAASGTVSLELAAARTPMVIAYDMHPLSRMIVSRLLQINTVTLVNLVSETRTIPECIGKACKPEQIHAALKTALLDPTAQYKAMDITMIRLGRGADAPGLRAGRSVLNVLK